MPYSSLRKLNKVHPNVSKNYADTEFYELKTCKSVLLMHHTKRQIFPVSLAVKDEDGNWWAAGDRLSLLPDCFQGKSSGPINNNPEKVNQYIDSLLALIP